jgi:hypothetical protein
MGLVRKVMVEPFYRIFFGRPLNDDVALERDDWPAGSSALPGSRALVVTAGGVGGFDLSGTALRFLLAAEGLPYAIHIFPWGHGFGRWFADLTDVTNRDTQARLLADAMARFRNASADIPLFFVGKSGGSGVIVKALERMEERSVERVILLAPALSPEYDLSTSLRAVTRDMVVFWSPLDVFFLGLGTRVFGTADRVKTAGAGMTSFRIPPAIGKPALESDRASQYAKLRQIRWTSRMAASGNLGGHFGPDSPLFLKKYVVPLLRTGTVDLC